MKIDMVEVEKRIAAGYIRRQYHPLDGNLMILNYTAKCQIERAWDQYTTLTRGLIVRSDGTVYARSFDKFYNVGEMPGTQLENLPKEAPIVTAKMDGFLGISYWFADRIHVASRGSFSSEYALWATEWLHKNNPDLHTQIVDREWTFVFEILYPHRRIVVDNSGRYGLVLLAIVHQSGHEMPRAEMEAVAGLCGFNTVPLLSFDSAESCLQAAKGLVGTEAEGYVLYWPSTGLRAKGLRAKSKGDDYCRIHKLVVGLTRKRVWDILAHSIDPEKAIAELAGYLPKSFANWLYQTASDLSSEHLKLVLKATEVQMSKRPEEPRKDFVARIKVEFNDVWHEGLYFLDGKGKAAIDSFWKRLEPVHEIPLISEGEDE